MSRITDLNRRTVLRGAAAAAATALPLSTFAQANLAGGGVSKPIDGMIGARARVDLRNGGTTISLADTATGRPLAWPVMIAAERLRDGQGRPTTWENLAASSRLARDEVVAVAAEHWGVDPGDCAVGDGQIAHAGSGRAIGYCVWVDVVT